MTFELNDGNRKNITDLFQVIYGDSIPVTDERLVRFIDLASEELTERELAVLSHRYGLDGGKPETLLEVSEFYGVTRERIRQVEAKAIRKMRGTLRLRSIIDG